MKESLFRVRLLPDGRLEYEDCRGRVAACAPGELGSRMAAVLAESDLPPVERMSAGGFQAIDAAARNFLPPHVQPHIGPAFAFVQWIYQWFATRQQGAAQARARAYGWGGPQPPPQPPPGAPPPPGADPHQTAYRRGHRVG